MKVRIKKTGQILNVEYDDDDLYKGWDGGAVWFYANEFDIIGDEESDNESLFTLTAEEVEIVRYHLAHKRKALDSLLCQMDNDEEKDNEEYRRWESQYNEISYILNKIKQWQENQK